MADGVGPENRSARGASGVRIPLLPLKKLRSVNGYGAGIVISPGCEGCTHLSTERPFVSRLFMKS